MAFYEFETEVTVTVHGIVEADSEEEAREQVEDTLLISVDIGDGDVHDVLEEITSVDVEVEEDE